QGLARLLAAHRLRGGARRQGRRRRRRGRGGREAAPRGRRRPRSLPLILNSPFPRRSRMDDVALFESLAPTREALLEAIGEVVVGQREVVDLMLTALFSDGHCLFVGVPGLAKTLLV